MMKRFLCVVGVLMVLGFGVSNSAMAGVSVYNASGGSVGNYGTIQAGVDACPVGGRFRFRQGIIMRWFMLGRVLD
ncbi:MAG: hypothetical protein V1749_00115 [Candidatus Desantisbacteria bacterium]